MNNKEFKPFDRIIVLHGLWMAAFFSHYKDDDYVSTTVGVYHKDNVLPYEGNESLLGTDKNPKSKRWRAEMGEVYWYVGTDAVVVNDKDYHQVPSDLRYLAGNYFRTQEAAEVVADKIKKLFNDADRT